MSVKQIFYNTWGSQPEEHESYFSDIEDISAFIAWGLEAQQSGWSITPQQMSTIAVSQHKEKFGTVRVYCTLAASEKVNRVWRKELRSWRERLPGDDSPRPCKKMFKQQCLERDMTWYRIVYMQAIRLWPHYEKAITCAASEHHLLETPRELEDAVRRGELSKIEADKYRRVLGV
jgi:hypothetical protein